jgi:bifunctional non-homologous end joining protein LigD
MKKAVRTNRVFVDWSQNDQHKTTISVYSLRAREHPTVSTPISWEEVEQTLKKKDAARLVFEAHDVLARVEKMGDLFEPVRNLKQKLPQLEGLVATSDSEPDSREAKTKAKPASKSTALKSTALKSTSAKRRKV